jgi:hypothetical protein
MSRLSSFLAALSLGLALFAADGAAAAADPTSRVVYGGRLEDAQGRPIGGIYPLTFSFFRTAKGGRAVWSEAHFVAVDNGVYAVELGLDKPFPKTLDLQRAWLGVSVSGGKEIVRELFTAEPTSQPKPLTTPPPAEPKADPTVGAPPQAVKGTYADQAGFAYEAEKAKHADAVGGLSATDLRNLVKQSVDAGKDGGKAKIGAAKRYSDAVGGLGGQPYTLECPAGFVVTGIRGQAAGYVDQISLICSPLE